MTDPSTPARPRPAGLAYPTRTKVIVVVVLALAIGGFVLAGLTTAQDDDPGFTVSGVPGQQQSGTNGIEALFPRPDAEVLGQQRFGIDLSPGWTGELLLLPPSGPAIPLPEDELILVPELDQIFYQPGDGKAVERLEGDRFCVAATIWDQVRGREGTERTESWCFNVV